MAAAGGDQAGGGEEALAWKEGTAGRGVLAVVVLISGGIAGLEAAGFAIGKDAGPKLDAVAEGQGVGMRGALFGTGKDVESAEDDLAAAAAIPVSQFVGAAGEGEVYGDADDSRHGARGWGTVEEVFVPVFNGPVVGSGGGETGQRERGGEDVLAEAGIGVLGIEGVQQEGVVGLDGWRRG